MKISSSTLILFLAAGVLGSPKGRDEKYPLVGYATLNGGTTGGEGGPTVTVSTADALISAVAGDAPKIVYVKGDITLSSRPKVGNNTSILGAHSGASLGGWGLSINHASNIIIRNIGIHHAIDTDAISATYSHNLWIDHCEFWSERSRGFDYYDGLVDITKGSDFVTISWNYFHTHWKTSLVGGDPEAQATEGKNYHLTYHHNRWRDLSTRTPAIRFGKAHVFNNFYKDISAQGIHPRSGATVLVEGNVFRNVTEPISTYGKVIPADSPNSGPDGDYEPDGFANERNNDFGGGKNNITAVGTMWTVPYKYKQVWTDLKRVEKTVIAGAGVGKIKV
ncbi:polysaccharide lyase family 1 protein [Geopyxis carbonaria]|nr:polysaccharide lyase family 1 protein [Geopyxis carbonaria]